MENRQVCSACRRIWDGDGTHKVCNSCREKARARRILRQTQGRCACGNQLENGFRKCAACRECNRRWAENNPEHAKEIRRKASRKWASKHKASCQARSRCWQLEHRDRRNAAKRRYRANHPESDINAAAKRRIRMGDSIITKTQWLEIMALWEWKCAYCFTSLSDHKIRTLDHVVPLVRGGKHRITNLVACCRSCNLSKKDHLFSEWRKYDAIPADVVQRLEIMTAENLPERL